MRRAAFIGPAAALLAGGTFIAAAPVAGPASGIAASATESASCNPGRLEHAPAGSDFSLSNVGAYNENKNLREDSVKPPFVEILENPAKVKAQLAELRTSGQRKISTILWHAPLVGKNAAKSRTGYLLNSKGGLKPGILEGLEAYYRAVREAGFSEVVVRFGLQGCARPSTWRADNPIRCPATYSDEIEDDNFTVIAQTHGVLDRVFSGTDVARWYDLAVEASGWPDPHGAYNARIWKRYVDRFGANDTYGFSIAYQPGRLAETYRAYDAVGVRPAVIAVDIYDGNGGPPIEISLRRFAKEMRALRLSAAPVVIQETFYNHAPSYRAIVNNARRFGMNIRAIYQWGMDTRQYWEATPARYEAYCPALVGRVAAASVDTAGAAAE